MSLRTCIYLSVLMAGMVTLTSCPLNYGYKYNTGELPDRPVNLKEFNTEYDDYNLSAPTLGTLIPLCFSTNRNSLGGQFDVIYKPMEVSFSKTTGDLTVKAEYGGWGSRADDFGIIEQMVRSTRTAGDELGPYLVVHQTFSDYQFTLMYASDSDGDFDVYFTVYPDTDGAGGPAGLAGSAGPDGSDGIIPVRFLNSPSNDLYPALDTTADYIYFCSDRDGGQFDIYRAVVPDLSGIRYLGTGDNPLPGILADTTAHGVEKVTVLSGASADKCPFIYEDRLVFASDREGGFGGFDLYYSLRTGDGWSEPVNFGPEINTYADEYRPVLLDELVTGSQIMMLFSSDREEGMGGFDLWFVGIS